MKVEIPIYNDPWFDNALVSFYQLLQYTRSSSLSELTLTEGKLAFEIANIESFAKDLSTSILQQFRSKMIVIQESENVTKEVKKDFVLLQEWGKTDEGKVRLREILFSEENEQFICKALKALEEENGSRNCVTCGRNYNPGKVRSKLKLKQSVYPLSTKIRSLSGIRTYKNEDFLKFSKTYHDNLCPLCYFIGVLNWVNEALIYRTFIGDSFAFLFVPSVDGLTQLNDFRTNYIKLLNSEERYSNIKVQPEGYEIENTPGKYSTVLCFYEKFLQYVHSTSLYSDWQILKIPLGNVKNVEITYISTSEDIMGILNSLQKEIFSIYNFFISKVNFFLEGESKGKVDWDITREIREELSRYFLEDDFSGFAKALLPKKGGHVGFSMEANEILEKILYYWRWNEMPIEKSHIGSIRKVGNIVAKTCGNNPSLLYKLDKVRNQHELWNALRQIARKMAGLKNEEIKGHLSPTALDEIVQLLKEYKEDWEEIKNLLVVYSSISYSLNKIKEGSK